jgi:hypothetical protein
MPKIETWDNLPAGVRQHLTDMVAYSEGASQAGEVREA